MWTTAAPTNCMYMCVLSLASFLGLPQFYSVWFAMTITHGSGRVVKNWEHSSCERCQVDTRWMYGVWALSPLHPLNVTHVMNALRLLLQFKHTCFLSNVNVHRKWHQNSISFTYLISVSVLCLVNALCKFSIQFSHVGVHPCIHAQVGLRNWFVSVCHQHSGELQQIRQFLESSFHSDLTTFLCLIDWNA